ncbi:MULTISPECIES: hypothetical protein [Cronobacter]|uniref:Uncharacterized protein n=1 Tax=Cronobacter sakazakii TaxID=28141 RepID=A0AAN5WZV8_CROSK|nr:MULTISPECIES: hypothetical protein [Cronobacter]EGT4313461.1 hypothetical protein [Cronobacter malonaticus]EGT4275776.1 hypothetical protein [Cronobacter sakazakii]EGT4490710.1 hypothetical protein [Cronobacter turicensis]EGT5694796.1 hypothetical protein [Cronobacter sakazakii]EGT5719875.1 hypothetical protein [Cronobacter sakazakii]
MSTETLLGVMKDHGVFENEENKVSGLAQRAIDNGYDSLSPLQKRVLEPFMSHVCDGAEDPGGNHNECTNVLTGEKLEQAYENYSYYDALLCEQCIDDIEEWRRQWERIRDE